MLLDPPRVREPTVGERLETLAGAARLSWLRKWRSWLLGLVPRGVDPATVYGYPLDRLDDVEAVLKEYCEPELTESECYRTIRAAVAKVVREPQTLEAHRRHVEQLRRAREAEVAELFKLRSALGLEVEVDPWVLRSAYDYVLKGEVDRAVEVVKQFLIEEYGWSEAEASREAEKIRARAPAIVEAARPREWWEVLRPVRPPMDIYAAVRAHYREQLRRWLESLPKEVTVILGGTDAVRQYYNVIRVPDLRAVEAQLYFIFGLQHNYDYRLFPPGSTIYYTLDPLVCWTIYNYVVVCNQEIIEVSGPYFRVV